MTSMTTVLSSKRGLALFVLTGVAAIAWAGWMFNVPPFWVLSCSLQVVCIAVLLHAYKVITRALRFISEDVAQQRTLLARQVQALFFLDRVIRPRVPLPPLGHYAATPEFLSTVVSLVRSRKPETILEFGSGSSTLVCAYALQSVGRGRVISFDHQEQYGNETRWLLSQHELSEFATVLIAPLESTGGRYSTQHWYQLPRTIPSIDLVIIDGPPEDTGPLARYPALPELWPHLASDAVIIVDDANRPDEREMVRRWLAEYPELRAQYLPHEKGTVVLFRETAAHDTRTGPLLSAST